MLMLLWHLVLILKEFTQIDKIGVIKKWGIEYLSINIFEKIILTFSIKSKKEFQPKESFHFLMSCFNILIKRVNLMKILDRLRHLKCFMTILIDKIRLEFGSVKLIRKRVDFLCLLRLWFRVLLIYFAFHPGELKFKNKNIILDPLL